MDHFVVIGAGQAGCQLVARLRSEGFTGAITLIGEEAVPPYQRPPLSKAYLMGEMPLERLFLRPESFYADQNITLKLGAKVERIDPAAREVHLAAGEVVSYDKLALTTGSTPRRLPATIGGHLPGVLVMRDLKDAEAMAPALVAGNKVVIIGGGYIGLEGAAVCAKKGLDVTLIEGAPRILQRVASAETSDYFRALHQSHGVRIIEGVGVNCITGADRATGVELADGTFLPADIVVLGVGITPNTHLAEAAGLTIDNGIWTDEFARTSDENIYAAGDCASAMFKGQRLRIESVGNAIDQADTAARNMLGKDVAYAPKPWFWSDQYDCKLQIAGLNIGFDKVVVRDDGKARSHWYYAGDQLIALDAMNDPRAYMVGKRLIDAGKTVDPARVADATSDLKSFLQ